MYMCMYMSMYICRYISRYMCMYMCMYVWTGRVGQVARASRLSHIVCFLGRYP